MSYYPKIEDISKASEVIGELFCPTPLQKNLGLSEKYSANIMLKREDLQIVRSYKIRGAFNKISSLERENIERGVVCASAGNHAQGVAYSCNLLKIQGIIFMPETTPKQKIEQVKMFGKDYIEVVLIGDSFDDANSEAQKYSVENNISFIHPFDDPKIIEGQATVGLEIFNESKEKIDFLFVPVGGGGLASGVGSVFKYLSPETKIVGVEPLGAQSMKLSLENGFICELKEIDRFVDGAAVKRVGELTFNICRDVLDHIVAVSEGSVCSTILELYNRNAIVVEPAGALSISALPLFSDQIKGKNVVCIVSGSNNDIGRTEEIRERSLLYEGLKHYFIIRFPQRSGALLSFVRNILGPKDDITHFSYSKKTNREQGPAVIGVELSDASDFNSLIKRMEQHNVVYEYINNKQDLFGFLI
ncbi:MAG: threonine dehydratase [Bacteroidetes bacterium GWF2_41_61]|nr:MAG: threonine dehydratase [Bacteroidetes bacterium GWE2_40_15]OFY27998.1 MAG: threonine dehydratase [Bacteroidetes bacterium GWF2_41_61]OFY88918.1 MAG: threonine dehydratase [Bacteroidetes bacterium RIFOXYA12_FULL_40_10]